MTKTIGISIYPEKTSYEETIAYLKLAAKYKFKRVFTSLLQVTGDSTDVINQFKKIIHYANSLDMEVILDVNPLLLPNLGASWKDLSFFANLGVGTLRLDGGYSGLEEMIMSHNPHGIKIELNMSAGLEYIDRIMSFSPNKKQLSASYNFYPQRQTGMLVEHTKEITKKYHTHHLPTTLFVSSKSAEVGPWQLQEGLCTLEEHRNLSLNTQLKQILLLDLADHIIIGNCFASEKELKEMSHLFYDEPFSLDIELERPLSESEATILNSDFHFVRPEYSEYVLRSAFSRHLHKKEKIKPVDYLGDLKFGDIIIANNQYGQYECELQIILQTTAHSENKNKIGTLSKDDLHLLQDLAHLPYQKFTFNSK